MVKNLGIACTLLGAFLALIATFIPALNFLLDQPFNWFISLCLLLIIGGLVAHIILNKRLPLSDEDEDETPARVEEKPFEKIKKEELQAKKDVKEEVTKVVDNAKKDVKEEVTKVVDNAKKEVKEEVSKAVDNAKPLKK